MHTLVAKSTCRGLILSTGNFKKRFAKIFSYLIDVFFHVGRNINNNVKTLLNVTRLFSA